MLLSKLLSVQRRFAALSSTPALKEAVQVPSRSIPNVLRFPSTNVVQLHQVPQLPVQVQFAQDPVTNSHAFKHENDSDHVQFHHEQSSEADHSCFFEEHQEPFHIPQDDGSASHFCDLDHYHHEDESMYDQEHCYD